MNEELVPYHNAINKQDRQLITRTEDHFNHYYCRMSTLSKETLQKLKSEPEGPIDKLIIGVPSYRVLDDPRRMLNYSYLPALKVIDETQSFAQLSQERK